MEGLVIIMKWIPLLIEVCVLLYNYIINDGLWQKIKNGKELVTGFESAYSKGQYSKWDFNSGKANVNYDKNAETKLRWHWWLDCLPLYIAECILNNIYKR